MIRAFPANDLAWTTFGKACASEGFYDFPVTTCCQILALYNIFLNTSIGEFEVVLQGTMALLDLDIVAALEKCACRVFHLDGAQSDAAYCLLDLDLECGQYAKTDVEELQKSQEKAQQQKERKKKFLKDWLSKKRTSMPAGHAAARRGEIRSRRYPPIPGTPSQADAKKLLPPSTSLHIWKGTSSQSWQFHYRPFGRRSFSWLKYGSCREALVAALRECWVLYAQVEGLKHSDCPIGDLRLPADAAVVEILGS